MKLKNGAVLHIAEAEIEDAEEILDYLKVIGGETDNLLISSAGSSMTTKDEEKFIRRMKDSEKSVLLVGKIDGEIVSIGSLMADSNERLEHHSNLGISVLKAYWGSGVGTAILNELISYGREHGIEIIDLEVKADNDRGIALYEKIGFAQYGYYEKYFKIDEIYYDMVMMNLFL